MHFNDKSNGKSIIHWILEYETAKKLIRTMHRLQLPRYIKTNEQSRI